MYYKNSLVIQAKFFYKIGTLAFKKCHEVLVFEKVEHIHCKLWGMFVNNIDRKNPDYS